MKYFKAKQASSDSEVLQEYLFGFFPQIFECLLITKCTNKTANISLDVNVSQLN